MREIEISRIEENQRIDKFLLKYLNVAPKSFVFKMIRKKNIKVNGNKIDINYILKEGDILNIYLSEETIEKFQEIKIIEKAKAIDIVYEDENILIVNKMQGILSHSNDSKDKDTLIDRILYYLYEKGAYNPKLSNGFTPALCNRLDINTSGLVVCGKNLMATQELNEIFKNREINKFYIAIVKGKVSSSVTLRGYHIKNGRDNTVKILKTKPLYGDYKEVVTKYEPVRYNDDYSILKIQLITGKSHQIRAHLDMIGHPIAGDRKYGNAHTNDFFKKNFAVSNQLLHSEILEFKNTSGNLSYLFEKTFKAELPRKFDKIIKELF